MSDCTSVPFLTRFKALFMHEGYEFRSERESGIETAIVHFHAVNYPILTYTLLVDQISFFYWSIKTCRIQSHVFFPQVQYPLHIFGLYFILCSITSAWADCRDYSDATVVFRLYYVPGRNQSGKRREVFRGILHKTSFNL